MASSVASPTNLLHAPFTFSFMKRGGGATTGSSGGKSKTSTEEATTVAPTATDNTTDKGGGGGGPGVGAVGATTAATATSTSQQQQEPANTNITTPSTPTTTPTTPTPTTPTNTNPYENNIKTLSTVYSVEAFWETYNFLKRPGDLPNTTTDYHFFRSGIKPTWEDHNNVKGGKWIVRLPKGLASRYWEEVLLALIGAQLSGVPSDELCGAVLSIRHNEDILGVWNRHAHDTNSVERIRDSIKKILQLPNHASMEYKPHHTSIQDRSSFRNTQVWKPKSLQGLHDTTTTSSSGSGSVNNNTATTSIATNTHIYHSNNANTYPNPQEKDSRRTTTGSSWTEASADRKLKRDTSGRDTSGRDTSGNRAWR